MRDLKFKIMLKWHIWKERKKLKKDLKQNSDGYVFEALESFYHRVLNSTSRKTEKIDISIQPNRCDIFNFTLYDKTQDTKINIRGEGKTGLINVGIIRRIELSPSTSRTFEFHFSFSDSIKLDNVNGINKTPSVAKTIEWLSYTLEDMFQDVIENLIEWK